MPSWPQTKELTLSIKSGHSFGRRDGSRAAAWPVLAKSTLGGVSKFSRIAESDGNLRGLWQEKSTTVSSLHTRTFKQRTEWISDKCKHLGSKGVYMSESAKWQLSTCPRTSFCMVVSLLVQFIQEMTPHTRTYWTKFCKKVINNRLYCQVWISLRTYFIQMLLSDVFHTDGIRSFVVHRIVDFERLDKSLVPNKGIIWEHAEISGWDR